MVGGSFTETVGGGGGGGNATAGAMGGPPNSGSALGNGSGAGGPARAVCRAGSGGGGAVSGLGLGASFLETFGLGSSLALASSSLESGLPCFRRVSSDTVTIVASIVTVSGRSRGL